MYTGFNEGKVNDVLTTLKTKADDVLEELTRQYVNILKQLGDNWGTQDSIQYVEENVLPAFKTTAQQIALALKEIGDTIKKIAIAQATDTGNTVTISPIATSALGEIANQQKSKLDNGYVGAYENLKSDVATAAKNLGTEISKKLSSLQSSVKNGCASAFTSKGISTISTAIESAIGDINASINNALTKMETDINTLTANADKFVKDIQAAGLRQASSN